jgi:nucleoside-diphosphate-sugar epimerase
MEMAKHVALIAGVTGIVGRNLAERLVREGEWTVYGLARRPAQMEGVSPVAADLTDAASLRGALAEVRPTHVFFTSWLRQPTEAENIKVNAGMVRNLLAALSAADPVQHVALVTGLKHYLGPFEAYGKGTLPQTPFREEQARLEIVYAAAEQQGFGWSIHRPHTIIGYAVGNAMNMGATLAAYASICRATGKPFVFPGSEAQWNGLVDVTDARLLADHLLWAATTPGARDQALNVVNGDVFRWKWMWMRIANWFGIEPAPFPAQHTPLEQQFAAMDAPRLWREMATQHGLKEPALDVLTSAWHTDADLGRPIEVVTDMGKSRRLGFREYQASDESFFDVFRRLRAETLIP